MSQQIHCVLVVKFWKQLLLEELQAENMCLGASAQTENK